MKKLLTLLLNLTIILAIPISASAAQASVEMPVLDSISFTNAEINEQFSSSRFDYTITLNNQNQTPTLDKYELSGDANIFVTYTTDETEHQNGISVTVEHENGSLIYDFKYTNVSYEVNDNNRLAALNCELCEVYPALNDRDTSYKLYVPSDLTELRLSATTQDVNAVCGMISELTLNDSLEFEIPVTVTASNGDKRVYTFEVKRLNKTSAEIKAEMAAPDFTSIVEGELFYQKPEFSITIISAAAGILLIILFVSIAKRLTVKVNDDEEFEFFDRDAD